jgi:signal transduction histidine kinase
VGADGQPVALATGVGRQVTQLTRGGEVLALLEHRRSLADDPSHLDDVVRAARLALENERLQASSRARLEDLRASRRLVVEADDAARQRLEHDLHDGAQQRLVSLALAIRLARPGIAASDTYRVDALDSAERELRTAIEELRTVSHGLYPAVLVEEGLAAGVESLRESSAVPIAIDAMPQERLPRPVEAAAWFAIVEATRDLDAGAAAVSVHRADGMLLVDVVRERARAADLTEVEDRIGALDGTLRVTGSAGSGQTVHAEIPCGL